MTCVIAGLTGWKACATATPSPLAPSSIDNTAADHAHKQITSPLRREPRAVAGGGKENVAGSSMEGKSWLTKVCNRIGGGGGGRPRAEKCEKCGVRSDTCRPNPSFISGRKHFLCGECRVSARNMTAMYQQLCRNLREASRGAITTTCNSGGDISSPPSPSPSSGCRGAGAMTSSDSPKVRPTSPESGYETATSLDSSSSSDRLSADPGTSTSYGECGRCCNPHSGLSLAWSPAAAAAATHHPVEGQSCPQASSSSRHVCGQSTTEVFGGAFKSERVHRQRLQQFMTQEWLQAQKQQRSHHAAVDAPPQQEDSSSSSSPAASTTTTTTTTTKPVHAHHHPVKGTTTTTTTTAATKQYDGYLEIGITSCHRVKYMFHKPAERASDGEVMEKGQCSQTVHKDGVGRERRGKRGESLKECYRCLQFRSVAFRAPFCYGWLCEDCIDDLL